MRGEWGAALELAHGGALDRPADLAFRRARAAAFAPGEFVGQEGFVSASEILALAARAGVAPGVSVLDLCCGAGGAGLFITRQRGCTYLGVDARSGAIAQARQRAADQGQVCRFDVATIPPLPPGRFDVVLLLETMLAFRDKQTLLRGVTSALGAGGRFAFTVEEGEHLSPAERAAMPWSETVWPTPLPDLFADLEGAGLRVRWHRECSSAHLVTVDGLIDAYAAAAPDLGAGSSRSTLDDLVAAHRLWSRWLRDGRVRKFAVVAEKVWP